MYTYVCLHMYTYIYIYIHMCIHILIYACMCMCICVHMYTYTYALYAGVYLFQRMYAYKHGKASQPAWCFASRSACAGPDSAGSETLYSWEEPGDTASAQPFLEPAKWLTRKLKCSCMQNTAIVCRTDARGSFTERPLAKEPTTPRLSDC